MVKHLAIIGEQHTTETPQPATFPNIQFQVTTDGAIFAFNLGNGLSITQAISAEIMQQLCNLWLESRQELMKQSALVAEVLRTKN